VGAEFSLGWRRRREKNVTQVCCAREQPIGWFHAKFGLNFALQ